MYSRHHCHSANIVGSPVAHGGAVFSWPLEVRCDSVPCWLMKQEEVRLPLPGRRFETQREIYRWECFSCLAIVQEGA